jgi:hypothetical protein
MHLASYQPKTSKTHKHTPHNPVPRVARVSIASAPKPQKSSLCCALLSLCSGPPRQHVQQAPLATFSKGGNHSTIISGKILWPSAQTQVCCDNRQILTAPQHKARISAFAEHAHVEIIYPVCHRWYGLHGRNATPLCLHTTVQHNTQSPQAANSCSMQQHMILTPGPGSNQVSQQTHPTTPVATTEPSQHTPLQRLLLIRVVVVQVVTTLFLVVVTPMRSNLTDDLGQVGSCNVGHCVVGSGV